MTWKRAVSHIVLLLLAIPLHSEELTLDQAVQLAVRQNRGIRNSILDVAKANNKIAELHTHLLPSINLYALGSQLLRPVDFTFTRGLFGANPPIPATDTVIRTPLQPTGMLVAQVMQPLSAIHRIHLNLRTLQTNARIAEEQSRQQRLDVVRNVKKLYYGIQQMESSRQSVLETLKLCQELDRLTANYVKEQVALESDALAVQANLARTEQSSLTLDDQEATAKEQLNQLLGRDVLTEFSVSGIAEVGEFETDIAAARRRALDMRPEVRKARLQIQAAEQDADAKKAEYIPDISVAFNTVNLLNFNQFIPKYFTSAGVTLSWEPFDWGRKKNELAEKRGTVEQAKNGASDAESLIVIDVNDKFRRLRQSRAQLRVARLARQAALENLRVVKNRYQVQASLLKDVLDAQALVEQANAASAQAVAAFWTAKAEFERALGEDQ